jgi:hypothetical protein
MMRAKQLHVSKLHLLPNVSQAGDARQTVMSVARRFYHVEGQAVFATTHRAFSAKRGNQIGPPLVGPDNLTRRHTRCYTGHTMKNQTVTFLLAATFSVLLGAGCGTLLGTKAGTTSVPVELGAATTNDVNLVAWEKVAQVLNATANPTSTNAPINTLLGAAIGLTTAFAGWYARHTTAKTEIAATLAANCPALNDPKKPT